MDFLIKYKTIRPFKYGSRKRNKRRVIV
ncbi:hypothetical protein Gogos_021880 [Gossypium gossypioides]|uniref:Uncharacterized protein n=1 Tax=Gossypium gossypioides TaxID=34282 RepID=A0A7J9D6F7_GOSGO|nr:hypothetical protein [Gossypium gossypioides]